jgi:hypothetical protein
MTFRPPHVERSVPCLLHNCNPAPFRFLTKGTWYSVCNAEKSQMELQTPNHCPLGEKRGGTEIHLVYLQVYMFLSPRP